MPHRKKCFVLDLDGTVYLGNIPIEGTVRFIRKRWNEADFYFLSNNTFKSPRTYVAKLQGMGIPAGPEHILTPTTPLVEYLRGRKITRAYLVGNADYTAALSQAMPIVKGFLFLSIIPLK